MSQYFLLLEHAVGFALFQVKEFENISVFSKEIQQNIKEFSTFKLLVRLTAFSPFKSATQSLEHAQNIKEGTIHHDLQVFVHSNLKSGIILGVESRKLGAALKEEMGISCQLTGFIPELFRGLRYHFAKFLPGLDQNDLRKAQLGLAHSTSRATLKFSTKGNDNLLIQNIGILDQIDKIINTWAMRLREWYSTHFPELYPLVPDNYKFAKLVQFIGDRNQLNESKLEGLVEIVGDEDKARQIISSAQSSMGMDMVDLDLLQLEMYSKEVIGLMEYRRENADYLRNKMNTIAPTLTAVIGETVGARLISRAGSLVNLAKCPASTVQVLGAEKALFRAIKTRGNTPKYGLIYNSSYIGKAGFKNKGRISRFLANKCAIASRLDCFSDTTHKYIGSSLKQQIEERLQFLENGVIPRKNTEVMEEALKLEAAEQKAEKKKQKKHSSTSQNVTLEEMEVPLKKKKKSHLENSLTESAIETQEEETEGEASHKKKKKKKKSHSSVNGLEQSLDEIQEEETEPMAPPKKKKKKMSHHIDGISEESRGETQDESAPETSVKKKKKKHQNVEEDESIEGTMEQLQKKKKKKSHTSV